YKSDDVVGRVQTYEAIVKGEPIPKPGVPESFRVLVKELQSLGLDIEVLDSDKKAVDLGDMDEVTPGFHKKDQESKENAIDTNATVESQASEITAKRQVNE